MKKVMYLLCATVISLTLSGCKKKSNEETEKPFTPNLDTQITGKIAVKGHYDTFEALDEQIHKFNAIYPNIEVTYSKVDNYTKKEVADALFIGDSAPDIYFINNAWETDARYTNLFANAEDLSDPSFGIDLANVRSELIYKDAENHVPSVPIFTNTYGMMVNEEIFANNNLSIPKTYEELVRVCNSLIDAGYENPVMSYKGSIYSLYFPYFLSTLNGNQEAVNVLNSLDAATAGPYLRSSLELTQDFNTYNFIDKAKCTSEILKDNTDSICFRFYKGDVPMMFTEVNRMSGSSKRETDSAEYQAHQFKYSFHPVPSDDKGGYYFNTLTLSFAVYKNSANVTLANEFMRFLIRSQSLNEMNSNKRQISPAQKLGDDKFFNSFKDVLADNRVLYNPVIGLSSAADTQARKTFDALQSGKTIDEAIAGYGTYA